MLAGHFIDSKKGRLFITQFGKVIGDTAILCLPSITEEMNLARAVIAKQAQYFANKGMPCFILDYYGTGDSEGEFEEADTDLWLENIIDAGHFLKELGVSNIILWGVRFGALLALSYQKRIHQELPVSQQFFWKPVTSGKIFSGQFLRIKYANAMVNNSSEKINWREYILAGNDVEVAGYVITEKMLKSIESLQVDKNLQILSSANWFELGVKEVTPLIKRLSSTWNEDIITIHSHDCPHFWQVPEIFSLPELESLTFDMVNK